jgi:hypothetical protein
MYLSLLTIPLTYSLISLIVFYVISLFLGDYFEMSWKNAIIIVTIVFIGYFSILVYLKKKGYSLEEIYGEKCSIHPEKKSTNIV